MPNKFNDAHRDKFPKAKYRVTNASEYNESLRRRGDLTVWVTEDVAANWAAAQRKTRGGQARYSDLAIEICLTLRVVFRLALRQTQGFMRSIARLMNLDLAVPDFSTLSRRGKALKITQKPRNSDEPITLIVDSTGLQMHGGTNWCLEKHGGKKPRKTWRKLHIAMNPATGEIIASDLTTEHVGDETALPNLMSKVDAKVDRFLPPFGSMLCMHLSGNGTEPMMAKAFLTASRANLPPISNLLFHLLRTPWREKIHSVISTS